MMPARSCVVVVALVLAVLVGSIFPAELNRSSDWLLQEELVTPEELNAPQQAMDSLEQQVGGEVSSEIVKPLEKGGPEVIGEEVEKPVEYHTNSEGTGGEEAKPAEETVGVEAKPAEETVGVEAIKVTVSRESPYCKPVDTTLDCDFKGIKEADVSMDELDSAIVKVFLRNAASVNVGAGVCARLAIYNVASMVFHREHACPPDTKFGLKLVNSKVNYVPRHTTRLDMDESSAGVADCHYQLQSLSVVRSNIKVLKVHLPVRSNGVVTLEHSTIGSVEGLELERRTQLVMVNTTVGIVRRNSLRLHEAYATLRNSKFGQMEDQALVLGPGATLSLKDVEGKVTFAGASQAPKPNPAPKSSPPGVPPKDMKRPPPNPSCPQQSSILWLVPCGLALIEAIVIIANCTNWFPALKGGKVKRGLEEGVRPKGGLDGVYSSSTYYYGNAEVVYPPGMRHRHDQPI